MADPTAVYHCSRCNDDMPAKFQKSHDRICQWASELESIQVDEVLVRLGL